MPNVCRKLTLEEQSTWDKIQAVVNVPERAELERTFLTRVMEQEENTFPREQITNAPPVEPEIIVGSVEWNRAMNDALKKMAETIPSLTAYESGGFPGFQDLEIELMVREDSLEGHPEVLALIPTKEPAKVFEDVAKNRLADRQNQDRATDVEDTEGRKEVDKYWRELSKNTGISQETLRTKSWDELNTRQKLALQVHEIPAGSIPYNALWDGEDTRFVMAAWEKSTGLPFLKLYYRNSSGRSYIVHLQRRYLEEITNNPDYRHIIRNKAAKERVRLTLISKDEASEVEKPAGVTPMEEKLAEHIGKILDEWKPIARYLKFMEAYKKDPTVAGITKEMPDTENVPDEVQGAIDAFQDGDKDELWRYLLHKDWGVIENGYFPRQVYDTKYRNIKRKGKIIRGTGHIMRRESQVLPPNLRPDLMRDFHKYNRSMGTLWLLRQELDDLYEFASMIDSKFGVMRGKGAAKAMEAMPGKALDYIDSFARELQGFPAESGTLIRMINRIQRWAYPVVFMSPKLLFRNILQPLWSAPNRFNLIKSLLTFRNLPASFRNHMRIFFLVEVDQSVDPISEFMFEEEETVFPGEFPTWLKVALAPFNPIEKGLDFMSHLAARIHGMSLTDRLSRSAQFKASGEQAFLATEQYKIDKDFGKWFRDSGIRFLSRDIQKYIVETFFIPRVNKIVPGLQELNGMDAAVMDIASEVTAQTLAMYDKASGSAVQREPAGRMLGSLLTFPRSAIQMVLIQVAKIKNPEYSREEKIEATKQLLALVISSSLLSSFIMFTTGDRRKQYSLINMFSWSIGGLSVGLIIEVFDFINDVIAMGAAEEGDRNTLLARIPSQLTRLGDTMVGFYNMTLNILEAVTDEPAGLDRRWLRQLRAALDENYTPEEVDKAERTVIEKFQKIVFWTEQADPTLHEVALKEIWESEKRLAELQVDGSRYKLNHHGSTIEAMLEGVDPFYITPKAGYSELTMFYMESRDGWDIYDDLPSDPPSIRQDWLKNHLEEEAFMIFWGKKSNSSYKIDSPQWAEQDKLLRDWVSYYNIPIEARPWWKEWRQPNP